MSCADYLPSPSMTAGLSVRKFEDAQGHVTGSEWLYSDDTGEMARIDTSTLEIESEHVGVQGKQIKRLNYG